MRSAYLLIFSASLFFCESASAGLVYFSGLTYGVAENGTTLTITVNRIGSTVASASVNVVSEDLTATSPADFAAVSETLSWSIGDVLPKSFAVSITDDLLDEGTERFRLKFLSPVGDVAGGDVTVSITDYEEGKLQLSSTYFSGQESDLQLIATINRVSGANGSASVILKSSASADAPPATVLLDYTAIDTTVSFADGESTKNVSIELKNDDVTEFSEWFNLTLSTPNNASLGSVTTANAEIKDSQMDFTSGLKLLAKDVTNLNIEKPQLLDLKQNSLRDVKKKLIDVVNAIPILPLTDVTAKQDTKGFLTIDIEADRLYFRPVALKKIAAGENEPPNIYLRDGGSIEFQTSEGWFIEAQPALADEGMSAFQKALAAAFVPKMVITENGNITIQQDQGAAPYEKNVLNNVVVNYSFYDRWNFRPSMLSSVTTKINEGFSLTKHPVDDKEFDVLVVYKDGSGYRQQILSSAPINGLELIQQLKSSGVSRCVVSAPSCTGPIVVSALNPQVSGGIISFDTVYSAPGGIRKIIKVTLFADYKIRKTPNFKQNMIGFTETSDINNDTFNDYKMIYANGEEQYFFLVSAKVFYPSL